MPAILFDLDGTLVDSREDLVAAGNVARATVGLPPLPISTVTGYVGNGLTKLLQRLLPEVDEVGMQQARAVFDAHYLEHCLDRTSTYDGVEELLPALAAAGWAMAVVTNKPRSYSEKILHGLGLDRWCRALVGGDEARKPDPAAVHLALERLRCSVVGGWMVGDHDTDIRVGHAAGLRVAWCAWGIGRHENLSVDAQLSKPLALLDVLGTAASSS